MPVEENLNKTSGITKDGVMKTEPALVPTANAAAIIVSDDDSNPSMKNGENNNKKKKRKKKGGPFSFFRAALVVMRSDSKKKAAPKVVDQEVNNPKENWKKIVGSMRPLHLQDNQSDSPPPSLPPASPRPRVGSLDDLILNNMMTQHPSSPAPSSLSGGTMSQYASASNLQELDKSSDYDDDDDEDPDEVFDALCGDEMIDAKAEKFIAQFYKQMKLEQVGHAMNSHHHHHNHHKGKSH